MSKGERYGERMGKQEKGPHQWPSILALAGNEGEIKFERDAEFPAEMEDRHVDGTEGGSEALTGKDQRERG